MEYIVAYRSSEANIRRKAEDKDFCHNEMNDMYIWALSRYPDKTYGDIVAYNNQFWCVVDAENAADALKVYLEKDAENKKEHPKNESMKKKIEYLDWYFTCDEGTADKDAQKAWFELRKQITNGNAERNQET